MDVRPLNVNKDIYNFEARIYHVYDNMPAKHRHTLQEVLIKSTIEMRHYTHLGCRASKSFRGDKCQLFSMALGYCSDIQDTLDHLFDMDLLNIKGKASLDMDLDIIRVQLSKLVSTYENNSMEASASGGNK